MARRSQAGLLFRCLAVALAVLPFLELPASRRTFAAIAPTIRNAIFLVAKRNPVEKTYVPIGTAFHVGDGWFRTAAHVATHKLPKRYEGKGLDDWALYQADEFGNPSQWLAAFDVVCVDSRWQGKGEDTVFPHDSALLRAKAPVLGDSLESSTHHARSGEAVSIWGFPKGLVLFESKARVTEVSANWILMQEEVGTPTLGGHSGSPLLDGSGKVVGIMVGGATGVGVPALAIGINDAEAGCPRS